MEPSYTEWKQVINADNKYELLYCACCETNHARLMKRFVTNRDGETEAQFRVECPICKETGKVYMHENVALISWNGGEHLAKQKPDYTRQRRKTEK